MNPRIKLLFVVGTALTIGRALDLGLWTDLESGLCAVGPVWLRYAALAVGALAAICIGRKLAHGPQELRNRCKASGIVTAMAGAFFTAAGFLRFAVGMTGAGSFVRAILEILCGQWLAQLAKSWLRKDWKTPTRSLTPAVLGSAVFHWCVLARFMENSSSWHRVAPTAMVWQLLAGLVCLSALARARYLPGTSDGRTLCAGGLAAFALCLCWELPHAAVLAVGAAAEPVLLPELFAALALCCVGALGGVCAAACARRPE